MQGAVGQDAITVPHRRLQISIATAPQGAAAAGVGNVGLAKRVVSASHSSTGTASWGLR
jgi:hypothetical protein